MREFPHIYSQRDPAWAAQRLGTADGATIGQYGCILTCQAMKAGYYGHEIKPNALDDIFTNRGLYQQGDLLPDVGIHQVFDDIQLIDTKAYSGPADMAYIKQLAADPSITVTIEVDFDHDPTDGIQTHFVELHDYDGTTLTIYDPWYGTNDNFSLHYGNNPVVTIQKIAVYKGTATAANVSVPAADFQKLVKNSDGFDGTCDELGIPRNSDKAVAIAAVAKLKADKATAQSTIDNLNKQIPDLEGQLKTSQNEVTSLTQQLQDALIAGQHADSGQQYKDLYIQAESDVATARQNLAALTDTTNRQIAQLKNTSYLTVPKGKLLKIALGRFLNLS